MNLNDFGDRRMGNFDWNSFFRKINPRIRYAVFGVIGNQRYSEDVIQEVRFKVWKNLPTFKEESNILTWVISIARNTAIDSLKKMKREEPTEEEALNNMVDSSNRQEANPVLAISVREILEDMPKDLSEILIKKEIEGYTYEELTKLMKLTKRKVESRLNKARIMFKDMCLIRKII